MKPVSALPVHPESPAPAAPVGVRAGDDTGLGAEPEIVSLLVWPRRPAASIGFTLLLVATLLTPVLATTPEPVLAAIALVPGLAIAYLSRLVFEALCPSRRRGARGLLATVAAAAFGTALIALAAMMLTVEVSAAGMAAGAGLTAGALFAAAAARELEQRLGTSNRRIVLVGARSQYDDLRREVSRRGDLHLAGFVSLAETRGRTAEDLVGRLTELRPTALVLAGEAVADDPLVAAAARLHRSGVRVRSLHELYEQEFRKVPASELSPAWFLFDVASIHNHRIYGTAKRLMETVAAALVLLALAPLLPLIALAVRLSGPGPILFHQVRVGRDGDLIRLSKFRTMVQGGTHQPGWGTEHAARITPTGRVLRRFRLDELPQLWSVIRGDLALVGPRPEQPAIVERLESELEFYPARHSVRPGLTGWAQVNHGYGGTMTDVLEKLQYEFFYIKHQSLMLDLRIIVATVRTMLSGSGR